MAVVSAISHILVGPIINRSLHLPGPTLAGMFIIPPFLIAGALAMKRGMILSTSTLNGAILSLFVPIGALAIPIYILVGIVLEAFYYRQDATFFHPLYSLLVGGAANSISVLFIALIGLGLQNMSLLLFGCLLGFISGAIGGVSTSSILFRIRNMR